MSRLVETQWDRIRATVRTPDIGATERWVPTPDEILLEKPNRKSAEYNQLIQNFCFVRPLLPAISR